MAIHAKLSYKFDLHIRVSSRSADGKGGGMRVEVEETGEWECFRLWITLLQFEYRISARSRLESRESSPRCSSAVHLRSRRASERARGRFLEVGWMKWTERERGFQRERRAPETSVHAQWIFSSWETSMDISPSDST